MVTKPQFEICTDCHTDPEVRAENQHQCAPAGTEPHVTTLPDVIKLKRRLTEAVHQFVLHNLQD